MSKPVDKKLLQAINSVMKLSYEARCQPLKELQSRELLDARHLVEGLSGRILLPAFEQWYSSGMGVGRQ